MLGRLEMTIEGCIKAYIGLMRDVFAKNKSFSPVGIFGGVKSRFSSKALEQAISTVLTNLGIRLDEKFYLGSEPTCKV